MEAKKIIFNGNEQPMNVYWINHYGTITIYQFNDDDAEIFEEHADFDEWGTLDNVETASADECKQLIHELKKEMEE